MNVYLEKNISKSYTHAISKNKSSIYKKEKVKPPLESVFSNLV